MTTAEVGGISELRIPPRKLDTTPVFLVGSERSGTTLLRLMLDHHPQIAFHFEFELAVDKLPENGGWPDLAEYHRWLSTHRIFQHSGFVIDSKLSYPQLMNSFLEQKRRRNGSKPCIGATVHQHFDRLPRIWPQARYIHLLRDPRDVAPSVIQMGWAGNCYDAVRYWLEAEQSWDRLRATLRADQFVELHYEELIRNPLATLDHLCAFFGVPYSPRMLDYPQHSSYSAPDPGAAFRWKKKLSARDVQLIEGRVGHLLQSRRYESSGMDPRRPGPVEHSWLMLQSTLRCHAFRRRRYGLGLYLAELVARRLSGSDCFQQAMNEIDAGHVK